MQPVLNWIVCEAVAVCPENFATWADLSLYIHITGDALEKGLHFKNLNPTIQPNGHTRDEVTLGVDYVRRVLLSLRKTWWSHNEINRRTRLCIHRAAVR